MERENTIYDVAKGGGPDSSGELYHPPDSAVETFEDEADDVFRPDVFAGESVDDRVHSAASDDDATMEELHARLGGIFSANSSNRPATDEGEVDRTHRNLNPFLASQQDGYFGGSERGYRPGFVENGNGDRGTKYVATEGGEPRKVAVRVGPNYIPAGQPIQTPNSDFRRPEPFTRQVPPARERVKKSRGLFTDAILGRHGDQADSFLG